MYHKDRLHFWAIRYTSFSFGDGLAERDGLGAWGDGRIWGVARGAGAVYIMWPYLARGGSGIRTCYTLVVVWQLNCDDFPRLSLDYDRCERGVLIQMCSKAQKMALEV